MGQFIKDSESTRIERETIHNLLEAACSIRHDLDAISSDFGISRSQLGVLQILKEAQPEGRSRKEIIDGLVEKCPDVTRLIDRLEEEGYVSRYRCEEDARVSIAKITEEGSAIFDQARKAYIAYLERMGKLFTEDECEIMSDLCKRLSEEMTHTKNLQKSA